MKSIKEKAIEIYPALEGDVSGTSENLVKRNGFQTGANYVLDNLSKTISVSEDGYLRDNLKKMIEQLKK